jgi:hypothetical protein
MMSVARICDTNPASRSIVEFGKRLYNLVFFQLPTNIFSNTDDLCHVEISIHVRCSL